MCLHLPLSCVLVAEEEREACTCIPTRCHTMTQASWRRYWAQFQPLRQIYLTWNQTNPSKPSYETQQCKTIVIVNGICEVGMLGTIVEILGNRSSCFLSPFPLNLEPITSIFYYFLIEHYQVNHKANSAQNGIYMLFSDKNTNNTFKTY